MKRKNQLSTNTATEWQHLVKNGFEFDFLKEENNKAA